MGSYHAAPCTHAVLRFPRCQVAALTGRELPVLPPLPELQPRQHRSLLLDACCRQAVHIGEWRSASRNGGLRGRLDSTRQTRVECTPPASSKLGRRAQTVQAGSLLSSRPGRAACTMLAHNTQH